MRAELKSLVIRYGSAWNIAFNKVDPHNTDKHKGSYEGMKKVATLSKKIEKDTLTEIDTLVTAEIIAELERLQHLVNPNLGTKRAYQDRINELKAKETQL